MNDQGHPREAAAAALRGVREAVGEMQRFGRGEPGLYADEHADYVTRPSVLALLDAAIAAAEGRRRTRMAGERPAARWPMGDCLNCGRRVNVETGEGHGPRCTGSLSTGDALADRLERHIVAGDLDGLNAGFVREILTSLRGTGDAVIDAAHLERQREWSERTFGPGPRTKGVLDHIRKELREIEAEPLGLEWVDVVILALDGAWRAGHQPQAIIDAIVAKQAKNEARTWPDWRTASPDHAIEHDRTGDAGPAADTLAVKIADRLAFVYLRDRSRIATVCDESIDRSGNLLGWLRDYARLGSEQGASHAVEPERPA